MASLTFKVWKDTTADHGPPDYECDVLRSNLWDLGSGYTNSGHLITVSDDKVTTVLYPDGSMEICGENYSIKVSTQWPSQSDALDCAEWLFGLSTTEVKWQCLTRDLRIVDLAFVPQGPADVNAELAASLAVMFEKSDARYILRNRGGVPIVQRWTAPNAPDYECVCEGATTLSACRLFWELANGSA